MTIDEAKAIVADEAAFCETIDGAPDFTTHCRRKAEAQRMVLAEVERLERCIREGVPECLALGDGPTLEQCIEMGNELEDTNP